MIRRLLLPTLLASSLAGVILPSIAAQSTTELQIRATVASTCAVSVQAGSELDFGSVASTAINSEASAQFEVTCTNGTPYTVALDLGDNADGSTRRMINGGNYLPYALYRSPGTSQPWTDQLSQVHSGTGNGANQPIPVYGVLPSANVPAGAYVDTVTATLTY